MKILWGEEGHCTEEGDRVRDFINKLSAGFRMLLPNTIHVFEDLDKGDMVSRKMVERKRRRNHRTPWRTIYKRISEVALTASVDPRNTSRECPRCGFLARPKKGRPSDARDTI